jgi:hypothetical protein
MSVRRVLVVVASAVAAALAAGCGGQRDHAVFDPVAIVRDGGLFVTDANLRRPAPAAPATVVDAAYDRRGILWYSKASGRGRGRCDLYRFPDLAPSRPWARIAPRVKAEAGLCTIWEDPAGGLLFAAGDPTVGPSIWHLDTASGAMAEVAAGTAIAQSPASRSFVVARGGSLWAGRRGSRAAFVRLPGAGPGDSSPAFSPDGSRLAVITASGTLAAGSPRARLRTFFVGPRGGAVTGFAWTSDSALIALVSRHGTAPVAYRAPLASEPARRLAGDVEGIAVRRR